MIHGKKYNFIEYYSDGKIKSMGNCSDSLATGRWIFYKLNGKVLSKGEFVSGIAKGKWIYHDYGRRRTYNWDWDKGFKPSTHIEIKENKSYILQTYSFSHGTFRRFLNGKYIGGGTR